MSKRFPIRSIAFIEGNEHGDEIVIPERLFAEWLDFFPHGESMLATLTYQDVKRIVCIGSSHASNFLYCPQWILSHLGSSLEDESEVSVEPFIDPLPIAERISVRVLDALDNSVDMRAAMETYLDRFHILEAGTTLAVPLYGGYLVCVWVEAVEPAGIVKLGGEVVLEFLNDEESESESEKEVEPVKEPEPVKEVEPAKTTDAEKELIRLARIKRFAAL